MSETAAQPGRTILIVDSDDRVRLPLADFLRACGYEIVEAETTEAAWTVLHDPAVQVDAVLCDFAAGGTGSALDLAAWATRERPLLPFLLTGNVEAEALAARDLCADSPPLARPYEFDQVLTRIRERLGKTR